MWTPKVSSVISKPKSARCQRGRGDRYGAMAADMSRCRRLTTKTAAITDSAPTPAPQSAASTNWPEPAKIRTDMAMASEGGIWLLTASTPNAKATGT